MAIDALSFYLPAESENRAPFKITLLLGYNVFLLMMNDLLPISGTPSSVWPPPHCWKRGEEAGQGAELARSAEAAKTEGESSHLGKGSLCETEEGRLGGSSEPDSLRCAPSTQVSTSPCVCH